MNYTPKLYDTSYHSFLPAGHRCLTCADPPGQSWYPNRRLSLEQAMETACRDLPWNTGACPISSAAVTLAGRAEAPAGAWVPWALDMPPCSQSPATTSRPAGISRTPTGTAEASPPTGQPRHRARYPPLLVTVLPKSSKKDETTYRTLPQSETLYQQLPVMRPLIGHLVGLSSGSSTASSRCR